MSIKMKLLAGCSALIMATAMVGIVAVGSLSEIASTADLVHSRGLGPVDGIRSVQTAVAHVQSGISGDYDAEQRSPSDPLSNLNADGLRRDLDIASAQIAALIDSDLSPVIRSNLENARYLVGRLAVVNGVVSRRKALRDLSEVNASLVAAVDVAVAEAVRLRAETRDDVDRGTDAVYLALGGAAGVALLVSVFLAASILPSVRRATGVAKAIARGELDNDVSNPGGGGEISELIVALGTTQTGIVHQIRTIETLMETRSAGHDEETALQNSRFQVAIDSMRQGLCLFDAAHRLVVVNDRFAEMFSEHPVGTSLSVLLQDDALRVLLAPVRTPGSAEATVALSDGRTMSVVRAPVDGGGYAFCVDDITERHAAAERISHLARFDGLTGLPNRSQFAERLDAVDAPAVCAVMMLDLDGFKAANDTLGHQAGDEILQIVARRLEGCIGKDDMVARMGGDEFAVVQAAPAQPESAERLARRIIDAVGESFPSQYRNVRIGVSVGIAFPPKGADAVSGDEILSRADLALYDAKNSRNTFRFYSNEMTENLLRRTQLQIDLREALARDELELHYQPFYDVRRKRICGFEALVRWNHPVQGRISPAVFIPIAEDTGMIVEMGRWILERACRDAALWPEAISVSVNLSPKQFGTGNLSDDVRKVLKRTGLAPERLQLEVTESLMLANTATNLGVLYALRELGVRLSMDDFGTGYSSLGYLTKFRFDKVKIDQSFVRDIGKPENLAVVRAVMGLCRSLDIAVIAEGVETQEQYDVLENEGCLEMQGYKFSPPVPLAELPALIMTQFVKTVDNSPVRLSVAAA